MMGVLHSAVSPILVIGVLVFIHELGHFLVAKWCGVGVVKFSVGFGPALIKFRHGETIYQLSLIPLGGYVRMVGDMPDMLTGKQATDDSVRTEPDAMPAEIEAQMIAESDVSPELVSAIRDRNRWFVEKNFWQRSAIVFAGPLFNFVLALLLVFVAVTFYGEERIDETATIGGVQSGSPAEKAGLQAGDKIISINGQAQTDWVSMAEMIFKSGGKDLVLDVQRGEEKITATAQPISTDLMLPTGEKQTAYRIGIEPNRYRLDSSVGQAAEFAGLWVLDRTMLTYWGLWGMVTGKVSANDLAGPLFIIDAAGKESKKGFDNLLYFTALLSVSLAVLNLLPIPILDGGHLVFFVIEALAGPISVRKKEFAQSVGMLLLIGLMVFALHNDITREPRLPQPAVDWKKQEPGNQPVAPEAPK